MKTAAEIADQDLVHYILPKPVGMGRRDMMNDPNVMMCFAASPMLLASVWSVSNRIERGVIPFPLCDQRCSYCLKCSRPDTPFQKCAKCKMVFYFGKECQKNHWKFHKKVCGTVKTTWNTDDDHIRHLEEEED